MQIPAVLFKKVKNHQKKHQKIDTPLTGLVQGAKKWYLRFPARLSKKRGQK
jgi:hypothetical protein